jgi:hypothetical protein
VSKLAPPLLALALELAACDPPAPPPDASSAGAPSPTVPLAPTPAPGTSAEVDEETSTRPVELLAFAFTSGVKHKAPVDTLRSAKVGQKVHAHLTLRNRTGRARKVELRFRVGGELRTELSLEVGEAWSWRTWGYNTVLASDRGKKLSLEVVDDEGHPLVDAELPIE